MNRYLIIGLNDEGEQMFSEQSETFELAVQRVVERNKILDELGDTVVAEMIVTPLH